MKALVIGSGGREHAVAWKLAQSEKIEKVYAAPGNGGTAREDKCENVPFGNGPGELPGGGPVSPEGQAALAAFAGEKGVDFTVVGPEDPLEAGIVDVFRARGLAVVGPDRRAARLEASKAFSKEFMKRHGVRTAAGREFTRSEEALEAARRYFGDTEIRSLPMVIKADGLAAGKGVVLAEDLAAAEKTITAFMRDKSLGEAGASVVIEDFLPGREVSVLAAVSVVPGKRGVIRPFIAARDHKRRFEGARGPNTGGMGAVAPAPDFDDQAGRDFLAAILEPTLKGMEAEGLDYRGFIFFGLMVNAGRCSLVEYNVRLGDPETQAVLPLLDTDFAELCRAILDGSLGDFPLSWKPGAVCAPVAAAEGYPGAYRKGDPISIDEKILAETGAKLFIAGAAWDEAPQAGEPGLRTSGGRVLAASAYGAGPEEARERAYRALEAVGFAGKSFRRDIGRE
jgi:phosphoribosylamine--glycine ligase